MNRAIIIILDSLGLGASADAHKYGDQNADTFGHIVEACETGLANNSQRHGPLKIPNLLRWGLGAAAVGSRKHKLPLATHLNVQGAYGHAVEVSSGKDTPSGHWEICGLPVPFNWGTFPQQEDCFPTQLMQDLLAQGQIQGTLANKHGSGTDILAEYGEQHLRTGFPICYTSADSVFQIAAHEETFGLERLYDLCEVAKKLVDPLNVARVIARPFKGTCNADFERTANRRDLTTPPMGRTLLDHIQDQNGCVVSVGKVGDIFAHKGVNYTVKADDNMGLVDQLLDQMKQVKEGLLFVNLVDFDSKYGHRRDVAGYANALEEFDARLPQIEAQLEPQDLVLLSADHGCDPTWPGSDHTREHVPVVFYGHHCGLPVQAFDLGERTTFADMGQTVASHLGLVSLNYGIDCQLN
ncbi:MAG: phosphopentomutase [Gammaproteobacteria bacterium]|jgi:phosphopentomutase|tara:strand:+ start:594 stop:1823 length:1230 start_codon:yes stop_codon:yes gene_type:complete